MSVRNACVLTFPQLLYSISYSVESLVFSIENQLTSSGMIVACHANQQSYNFTHVHVIVILCMSDHEQLLHLQLRVHQFGASISHAYEQTQRGHLQLHPVYIYVNTVTS